MPLTPAASDAIVDVYVDQCVQPQQDPAWRFALGGIPRLDGLIVTLRTERGIVGEGHIEAMALYADDLAGSLAAVDVLRPVLLGGDPLQFAALRDKLDNALAGHEAVKAGVDSALHELASRSLGVPLHVLFGGARRHSVDLQRILPLKDPQGMAADAARLAGLGYRCLKVKIDGDGELAVARVKAVRDAVGDSVRLSADANQSFTPKTALHVIERIARYGVDLVEQPVPAADVAGLGFVTRRSPIAIEADEAIRSLRDIVTLIAEQACDSFNLKTSVLGGLGRTYVAAQICEAAGRAYRVGTAYGPRLVAAQCLHLAVALPSFHYPVEFAEFDHLLDDPFTGLEAVSGMLELTNGLGSGLEQSRRNA
ncbi:mandelate racemase/muconate lactonizing enzyme family protein [Bosea sp. 2KB_26]|uniref:mandelate racemase/muconate lactonizing enzyme family protein n=1 Tax=Bosea sp. 2KB_26 TaxID=3237475 RepID=UPI003F9008D8